MSRCIILQMPRINEAPNDLAEKVTQRVGKLKSYFDHAVNTFDDFLELIYINESAGDTESDSKLKTFLYSSLDDLQTNEQLSANFQEFKDYLREKDENRLNIRYDSDVYQKKGLKLLTNILMGML